MKLNATSLTAAGTLWAASLIAAWYAGKHQTTSSLAAVQAGASAAGARAISTPDNSPGGRRGASIGPAGTNPSKPLTAKQIIAKVTGSMRAGSMMNPMGTMKSMALLDEIRPEDIPAALAEVEGLRDQQQRMMLQMALLGKWAETDAPAAMQYAEEHPAGAGMMAQMAKLSVAAAWAEKDPDAVWAWYKAQPEDDKSGTMGGNMVLASLFSQMAAQDPAQAFRRLEELDGAGRQMALAGMFQASLFDEEKRSAILAQVDALPDTAERTQARQAMLGQWAMMAPDEALDWVKSRPAAEQGNLREAMGPMLMMSEPKKGADFLLDGATDEQKPQRYLQVIASWAALDTNAAGTWLSEQPQGPHLDDARLSFVGIAAQKDPESAMAWAGTIENPDKRVVATVQAFQAWQKTDAAAAETALTAADLTPEQMQIVRDTPIAPTAGAFPLTIPAVPAVTKEATKQ
ncbi:MAG: hypothetical protein ACKV19_07870 [Verrucomicrobiales bacterium]